MILSHQERNLFSNQWALFHISIHSRDSTAEYWVLLGNFRMLYFQISFRCVYDKNVILCSLFLYQRIQCKSWTVVSPFCTKRYEFHNCCWRLSLYAPLWWTRAESGSIYEAIQINCSIVFLQFRSIVAYTKELGYRYT